ncbi:MAG TPA: hypothetical protein VLD67_01940 [Vicinamibacterales bacterium]|nr:hypothetical protein [Vicinamibacterales bacterium]
MGGDAQEPERAVIDYQQHFPTIGRGAGPVAHHGVAANREAPGPRGRVGMW